MSNCPGHDLSLAWMGNGIFVLQVANLGMSVCGGCHLFRSGLGWVTYCVILCWQFRVGVFLGFFKSTFSCHLGTTHSSVDLD